MIGLGATTFLKLIKNQIESEKKIKISGYSILHNITDNALKFIVEGKEYPFDNKSLMGVIANGVKAQFGELNGHTLDRILINYNEKTDTNIIVFSTDKEGKKTKTEKLLK